jgi:hypothetical protein
MKLTLKLLLLLVLIFAITPAQQKGLIPVFDLHKNDLKLERIAQANQYFDRIGKKAALMGFENGSFEMWIWPWKVFRNFDLQFFRPSSTVPINASEIVRTISVTPEVTVINYSYETFSVKVIYLLPREEAAAILLLDINTAEPLTIVPGFIPVMQPQWPAGIGGQYSYWDDEIKCFIISESQQRGLFLCGSPLGEQMSAPPAHMFADNPLQFKLEIDPDECKNHYVPIIICGSPVKTKYDSVKIYYNYILNNIQRLYEKNSSDYNAFLKNTINLTTPDEKINSAFRYGKIALYNLQVDNPNLGKGLVAGYGLSGGGGRPGFSWFFGGDAFINSLSLCSFQDFETVKDALRFTQKWQRQENYPVRKRNQSDPPKDIGKMAHELSQSDGLCDWWNDYHFGYNHADTTPWYLVAIGNYFIQSGDVHFIKQSWDSIVKAFDWCLSKDSDNDGLMDLKGAGLGVLEFGSLVKIHNDIYTQAVYLQGLKFLKLMAEEIGDSEILEKTIRLIPMAEKRLDELYWIDDLQFYSFGANENDQQVREKSIFSSSALMFNLLDEKKSERTIRQFNSSDMVTDWGIRNLSNNSELYHPSNYNYGTV